MYDEPQPEHEGLAHIMPMSVLLTVFATLMVLTVATVAVTQFDLGAGNLWIAMGVATLKAFVLLFPPGLVLSLFVIFKLAGMDVPWLMLLAAAPWIVIGPLMAGSLERRTTRAVEALVRGMAHAAERSR